MGNGLQGQRAIVWRINRLIPVNAVISSCPMCGVEFGVTHGDQLWVSEECEDCVHLDLEDDE